MSQLDSFEKTTASRRILHNIGTPEGVVGKVYSTCRNGTKWATVEIGEVIDIYAGETPEKSSKIGEGIVDEVWWGPYHDIPARLVESNHSPDARTYTDLAQAMRKAYGDAFAEDEVVVNVVYKRIA